MAEVNDFVDRLGDKVTEVVHNQDPNVQDRTVKESRIQTSIINNVQLGIATSWLLIASTVLGSEFFGLPKYLLQNKGNGVLGAFLDIFGFIFIQIWLSMGYLAMAIRGIVYLDGTALEKLNSVHPMKYDAIKNIVAMAIFSVWCILLYQSSQKLKIVEEVFDDKTKKDNASKLGI